MRTPISAPATRPAGAKGLWLIRSPTRLVKGSRVLRKLRRLASIHCWRSSTRARVGSSAATEAGELPDQVLRPGGDGVEVGLEGGGQVRRLERVVAGDATRQPLRQPPVDRLRGGARRAHPVDFLPTRMPYLGMTTLTT